MFRKCWNIYPYKGVYCIFFNIEHFRICLCACLLASSHVQLMVAAVLSELFVLLPSPLYAEDIKIKIQFKQAQKNHSMLCALEEYKKKCHTSSNSSEQTRDCQEEGKEQQVALTHLQSQGIVPQRVSTAPHKSVLSDRVGGRKPRWNECIWRV